MTTTNIKQKISFMSIALGALVMTSLSTGNAEASWSSPRCKVQCTKNRVTKDSKRLNDCAANCDNRKMIDILLPNAEKLNKENLKHLQPALKYQQSLKEKEHTDLENQLLKERSKPEKKQNKSKVEKLKTKQEALISEINEMGKKVEGLAALEKQATSELPALTGPASAAPARPSSALPALTKPYMASLPPKSAGSPPPPGDVPPPPNAAAVSPRLSAKGHPIPTTPLPALPTEAQNKRPSTIEEGRRSLRKSGSPFAQPTTGKSEPVTGEAESQYQAMPAPKNVPSGGAPTPPPRSEYKTASPPPLPPRPKSGASPAVEGAPVSPSAGIPTPPPAPSAGMPTPPPPPPGGVIPAIRPAPASGAPAATAPKIIPAPAGMQPQAGKDALLGDIKTENPLARLKKFNPEEEAARKAAADEKLKPKQKASEAPLTLTEVLKKGIAGRKAGSMGTISPKDQEKLDNLLNKEKKTPQQIRQMMASDEGFGLFDDDQNVEEALQEIEKK